MARDLCFVVVVVISIHYLFLLFSLSVCVIDSLARVRTTFCD